MTGSLSISTITSANASDTPNQVESASYTPASLVYTTMAVDESGYIWIFGGYFTSGSMYLSNNLWRYNPTTNMWACWYTGNVASGATSAVAAFATKGVESAGNIVPSVNGHIMIADKKGNLWVFGGSNGIRLMFHWFYK